MMTDIPNVRRQFLTSAASGLGNAALLSMLQSHGIAAPHGSIVARHPHLKPTAKICIFIFLAGGRSQVDLFDPNPGLNRRHGQRMPDSMLKDVEFAFIKKDDALRKGTPARFRLRGECGLSIPI